MQGYKQQKIWDPVTRLWHWILAIAVSITWVLGEYMEFTTIQWHFFSGYLVGGLLVFRIFWGTIGPQPIRLKQLAQHPSEIVTYTKRIFHRSPSGTPGHNPIGSASVIVMLVLLAVQVISGMFNESDDFFESAPLAAYVTQDIINRMSWIHSWCSKFVLIVVCLHIAAILFYLIWKKENLVRPMISGWKWVKKV